MAETDRYDLVVLGATPGGIASAVRGNRAGLESLLVTYHAHLGGMTAGGLSVTDTTLEPTRARSPLLDEFFERVRTHYRDTYGADSSQYDHCQEGLHFEPKVAESIFEALIEEAGVDVHRGYHPVSVTRSGRNLQAISFDSFDGTDNLEVHGETFIDATYEGDLAAVAGVPYRVGREGREEFGEQYAGRLFSEKGTRIFPGSTGTGDDAVQAYDYRLCLSKDPANRRLPDRPNNYDREEFLPIVEDGPEDVPGHGDSYKNEEIPCHIKSELVVPTLEEIQGMGLESLLLLRGPLPNEKRDLNTADLPGEVDDYPEANWDRREEIAKRHEEHVLGLLYFLQNDPTVPDDLQEQARQWGLPQDEFEDNNGFPFPLYVREARRIEGRTTFTEHDARLAEGLQRAPINHDSIAIAEYAMDSHDCRPVRRQGSLAEGHHFLPEITVPSQVPYNALLPEEVDNLLVPVPLSATHVGFGTIRLEPTWMQIGEAAGYAAALAAETGTSPGDLHVGAIQRQLVEDGAMITFFDDVHVDSETPGVPAAQFLGTKGFFRSYDARLDEPLRTKIAEQWAQLAATVRAGDGEPTEHARGLPAEGGGRPVTAGEFAETLQDASDRYDIDAALVDAAFSAIDPDEQINRGLACTVLHDYLS